MAYLDNPRNLPGPRSELRVFPHVAPESSSVPLAKRLFNLGTFLGLIIPAAIAAVGIYSGAANTWINRMPSVFTLSLPATFAVIIFVPLLCSLTAAAAGWLIGKVLDRSTQRKPNEE